MGEGLGYALVGGYGNTVPALIAIVASLIGLLKTFLTGKSGALAFLSGKLAGMVLAIAIVLGVFANAIVAYLKLQDTDGLPNVYVSILGSPVFEVVIVVCLVLPMFFQGEAPKARSEPARRCISGEAIGYRSSDLPGSDHSSQKC